MLVLAPTNLGASIMLSHPAVSVRIYLHLQQGLPAAMKTVLVRPSHPALSDTTIGAWTCSGTALEIHHCETFSARSGPRELTETQARLEHIAVVTYKEVLSAWQQVHLTYELFSRLPSEHCSDLSPPDTLTVLPPIFDVVWEACEQLEQSTLARLAQFGHRAAAPPPPT